MPEPSTAKPCGCRPDLPCIQHAQLLPIAERRAVERRRTEQTRAEQKD